MSRYSPTQLTQTLESLPAGDPDVERLAPDLLAVVYDELRQLAKAYLRGERGGHTLQPTALVHEAYLRLIGQDRVNWQGRTHFFAIGAQMMRRLLIDHARRRDRVKRGAGWQKVSLDPAISPLLGEFDPGELLDLDRALDTLAELDPRQARIVELRFFAGLTVPEVAELLGVSKRTVEGDWSHARAWLRRELSRSSPP